MIAYFAAGAGWSNQSCKLMVQGEKIMASKEVLLEKLKDSVIEIRSLGNV